MKILIVEDEPTTLLIAERLLTKLGHTVYTATSAEEGLKALSSCTELPVILLDWHLPGMSGPSFALAVRGMFPLQNPYIIMATHTEDPDIVFSAFELGVSDFVPKPITAAHLWARVRTALHRIEVDQRAAKVGHEHSMLQIHSLSSGILAHLIHEIANPLAMIGFISENLKEAGPDQPREAQQKSYDQLNKNVNRIREILKGERDRLNAEGPSHKEELNLADVVDDALATMMFRTKDTKIDFNRDLLTSEALVMGNRTELFQVVINLVANALDAIEDLEDRWIHLSIAKDGARVTVEVKNSGPPLSLAIADKLLKAPRTTKQGHSGIGIRLCQSILKDHGGELGYSATDDHTCFIINLPVAPEGA